MESAQLRMERMLPELRDLEQKKIFTKTEISAIITQRNYYEALITRPKRPECYLKYIEYEKRLEKLRRLRVGKYGHGKGPTTLSDYSIPLHILNLYSSAAKRFPESLELWISYIAFSLTQSSNKLVTRVLSAAIAAHPSHSDFWVMASRFEADGDETGKGGGNIDGARKLLMRGLRFLKKTASIPLWVEWIRIELNLIQTIEKRRKVFGLVDPDSAKKVETNDSTRSEEFDNQLAIQTTSDLLQLAEDPEAARVPLHDDIESEEMKGQTALLSGALVKVVLQNSFKAVPDLSIFTSIFPILHSFDSPLQPVLLDFVYDKLSQIHPDSPQAIIMLKTRRLFNYSKNGKILSTSGEELIDLVADTIQQLQKACQAMDGSISAGMSEEFLRFLNDLYTILKEDELKEYVSTVIRKTIKS